jgi:hypothetical protein
METIFQDGFDALKSHGVDLSGKLMPSFLSLKYELFYKVGCFDLFSTSNGVGTIDS